MQLSQVKHDKRGWSDPLPTAMDSERTLVVVFGATEYIDQPDALAELGTAFPHSHVIGCSTAGEIAGTRLSDASLSVAIAKFSRTDLATVVVPVDTMRSFEAGCSVADRLSRPGLRAILVLSDGLNVNGSEIVKGINSVVAESVVVTGGLAGDGDRFKRTWVLDRNEPKSNVLCAVGFYGDAVAIGHGSKGGWDKFGPERRITRSSGNILYELDGRPALELYKEYLGERASGLPATGLLFPLSIRASSNDTKALVRTILAVNEADQSLTFAGDVPTGHFAQLMKANFDRLITGASDASVMTRSTGGGGDGAKLAIAISCVGRRLVLGERTEEELEATADALPKHSVQVGFYSYGEISPYATGRSDLHNQTMTMTVIGESGDA